jgi:putative ABC transport system permease protein
MTDNAEFSADTLQAYLSEFDLSESDGEIGGDWNFIILRLEKGVSPGSFISALNKKLKAYGVTAVSWRIAAGTSAILLLLIQSLFNAGVFLVSVAGVIAAINILLVAVFRRTREIGTLRAIGASDAYIRILILLENFLIALAAGFAGILFGLCFLRFINRMGIIIPNDLIASLLGGAVLQVELSPQIAGLSVMVAVILGAAASVYPVEIAVRIEPMAAVRRG